MCVYVYVCMYVCVCVCVHLSISSLLPTLCMKLKVALDRLLTMSTNSTLAAPFTVRFRKIIDTACTSIVASAGEETSIKVCKHLGQFDVTFYRH